MPSTVAGLYLLTPSPAIADPCLSSLGPVRPSGSSMVSYSAKPHEAGYRFSLGGASWELQEARVTDVTGGRTYSVTYPLLLTSSNGFASRDFFFSVNANESDAVDCSDLPSDYALVEDWLKDNGLLLVDDYRSQLRRDTFSKDKNQLETMRTLGTQMLVREAGVEIVIATGFASTQSMDLGACLKAPGDSFGVVENGPGEVHVTCFPANDSADHVSSIDWVVDYHWPADAPALIDELIDYVHVERLP